MPDAWEAPPMVKWLVTFRKDPGLVGFENVEAQSYETALGWITFKNRPAQYGPAEQVAAFPASVVQSVTRVE